jgi:RNA polymerase sigma factor (sigma-70 family)
MQDELETMAIKGAQSGDPEAWAKLFEWHFEATYLYCLRLCQGRQDMAEESTQETLMTATRRITRFKPQSGAFRMWLFGIARNKVMKLQTAERRRKGREHHYFTENHSKSRSKSQEMLSVHEILAKLPFKHRYILECKYLKRLTVKEIAIELNTGIAAAESALRRAREKFASLHEDQRNTS